MLVAFVRIDAPAHPAEPQNLLPDELAQERLWGMLALLACSGLLYLLVASTRGRVVALLACCACACLPPVLLEGYVIRAEQWASMYALLGMLLFTGMPHLLRRGAGRRTGWLYGLRLAGLMLVVSLCFAMAGLSVQSQGILLLVPGGTLFLVVAAVLLAQLRIMRRRSMEQWPYKAAFFRLLPWLLMCLCNFLVAVWLPLQMGSTAEPVEGAVPMVSELGLLPAHWLARMLLLLLACLGALRLGLIIGLRLGRQTHLQPQTCLLVYMAVMLLQHILATAPHDALPVVPVMVILIAEGLIALVVLLGMAEAKMRPR